MQYEDFIKVLKRNRPVSSEPGHLTGRIMQITGFREGKNGFYRPVMYSARVILTIAASFLIVFFIIEQQRINTKLEKLENSIVQVKYPELINNYNQVRYEEFGQSLNQSIPYDSLKETLVINRKTLDFLLSRIRKLESENSNIREKLNTFYNDSLTIHTSKQ